MRNRHLISFTNISIKPGCSFHPQKWDTTKTHEGLAKCGETPPRTMKEGCRPQRSLVFPLSNAQNNCKLFQIGSYQLYHIGVATTEDLFRTLSSSPDTKSSPLTNRQKSKPNYTCMGHHEITDEIEPLTPTFFWCTYGRYSYERFYVCFVLRTWMYFRLVWHAYPVNVWCVINIRTILRTVIKESSWPGSPEAWRTLTEDPILEQYEGCPA